MAYTKELTELIEILSKHSELPKVILQSLKTASNLENIRGVILHNGRPLGLHECSRCLVMKDNNSFKYYTQRVDKNGYLMRSNALCTECTDVTKTERESTLKKAKSNGEIGEKPSPGSVCPNCNRIWGSRENPRNWHRDHDAKNNTFRGWLCGDCNMAKHDHRHNLS